MRGEPMAPTTISALPLGLFSVPDQKIAKYPGLTASAPYVVCAYVVRSALGNVLFDTGIVGDADAVERYRPMAFDLDEQLSIQGLERSDISAVVNCHLHADHAGGNYLFRRVPIFVQISELATASAIDYTVREACVDFPRAMFVEVEGRIEILPGIT